MNDRAVSALDAYDIEVQMTRKGRGTIICDTKEGPLVLVPYRGTEAKLLVEDKLLHKIEEAGVAGTDRLIRNKEGNFLTKDADGLSYILKTYHEGKEFDIKNRRECTEMMELLAKLHEHMTMPASDVDGFVPYSPWKEYEKHNTELRRIFSYLKAKGQKQCFERRLYEVYRQFSEKAVEAATQWCYYEEAINRGGKQDMLCICHGDYQYHNVLKANNGVCVVHFEKWIVDRKVRDVYLLLRKLMEKNDWNISLGKEMLHAYQKISPFSAYDFIDLYYRLAYPEKFWKIANYYYNSPKAWISGRNLEKLEAVVQGEEDKAKFLREVFQGLIK